MIDKITIKRFFAGEASEKEAAKVLEWINSDAFEKELPEVYAKYLNDITPNPEWDEYQELEKFKNRLHAETPLGLPDPALSVSQHTIRRDSPIRRTILKTAATFLIMISISLVVWKMTSFDDIQIISAMDPIMVEKSTTLGQKSTIFLEDGSRVVLNSGSRISFPERFAHHTRMVELEGEAYFHVKSDSLKSFIVKSGDVTTIALGTSFNINAYSENEQIISLVSGKVIVEEQDGEQIFLLPGEQVVYRNDKPVKSGFDIEETTAWKDGVLHFRNAGFMEITQRLERWYGVEISVMNQPAKAKHYTGRFNNESLENVLKGIGFINDFKFQISGKQVTISFN